DFAGADMLDRRIADSVKPGPLLCYPVRGLGAVGVRHGEEGLDMGEGRRASRLRDGGPAGRLGGVSAMPVMAGPRAGAVLAAAEPAETPISTTAAPATAVSLPNLPMMITSLCLGKCRLPSALIMSADQGATNP